MSEPTGRERSEAPLAQLIDALANVFVRSSGGTDVGTAPNRDSGQHARLGSLVPSAPSPRGRTETVAIGADRQGCAGTGLAASRIEMNPLAVCLRI